MPHETGIVSISQHDWSLHTPGSQDAQRHNDKVKEAIRDNLEGVISDGSIITADPNGKRVVKVPMRALEIPHIIYKQGNQGVGSGEAGEGEAVGVGPGPGAGRGPGEEYYEAELDLADLKEMVFADMGLPFRLPKKRKDSESERVAFDSIKRRSTLTNLDVMRTVGKSLERTAVQGEARVDIIQDDFRNRIWRPKVKPEESAAVLFKRDISGSMGEFEVYITRAFCWWALEFLRSKYPRVELAFLAHDTEAYEVDEDKFFRRGAGGGTRCASVNELALTTIADRFPPDQYNIYSLHFSDGDTWGNEDNSKCVTLVKQMLELPISQYAYLQIGSEPKGLYGEYRSRMDHPHFYNGLISGKDQVWPALQQVFDAQKVAV